MAHATRASLARSWLFCPASAPERLAKAAASGADAVIVDLEDGVPPADKERARAAALAWLAAAPPADVLRCLRINALRTTHGLRDVLALAEAGAAADLVMLPKSESVDELALLDAVLGGAASATAFLPLVETARGLGAADALAAHPRVAALVLGGADLAADLGAEMAWEPLLLARARLVQAAATAGVAVVDVPHLALGDEAALAEEATRVRRLGFTGKLAIHPRQVATINAAFTPSESEVERARRVVEAVRATGGGVAVVDGKMVDAPLVRAAERVVRLAHGRRGA